MSETFQMCIVKDNAKKNVEQTVISIRILVLPQHDASLSMKLCPYTACSLLPFHLQLWASVHFGAKHSLCWLSWPHYLVTLVSCEILAFVAENGGKIICIGKIKIEYRCHYFVEGVSTSFQNYSKVTKTHKYLWVCVCIQHKPLFTWYRTIHHTPCNEIH